jgi:RimJ/RimL family protein N-acetyltransferase
MPVPMLPIDLGVISLRAFERDDYEQFCAYRCRPDVARYMRWSPDDRKQARTALRDRVKHHTLQSPGDRLCPAIIDTATGQVIGELMLAWKPDDNRQGEIGFALHPDHQGKGYAQTAAGELLRVGFDEVGLHRIAGGCDPRNGPSAALMTRLGMHREAHLREVEFIKGEWCDELVFAIVGSEWRASI